MPTRWEAGPGCDGVVGAGAVAGEPDVQGVRPARNALWHVSLAAKPLTTVSYVWRGLTPGTAESMSSRLRGPGGLQAVRAAGVGGDGRTVSWTTWVAVE